MNFLGLIVTLACFATSQQAPQMIAFQQSDAIVKRQAASYSTNVIHHNPKYTDGQAESSVQFEFHTGPQVVKQSEPVNHQPSDQEYAYTRQHKTQTQVQYTPQKQIATYKNPTYSAPAQSQAVNVGYSVSFAGPSKSELKANQYTKQNYDNSDIITGYRKEVVRQPTHDSHDFEPKDFVANALDLKKQRISGIKPKHSTHSTTNQNTDGKNFINNLSPKTIEHLSKLGVSKPNDVQQQQQQHFKIKSTDSPNAESPTSPWVNLSPYVELYRSNEENKRQQKYKAQIKQAAINTMFGKPQVFDFTNVVETQAQRSPQSVLEPDRRPYGRDEKVHPNLNPQEVFKINYDEGTSVENFGNMKALPLIQMPTVPQFGIDTSLLRNAGVAAQTNQNLISIPIDTSLYEAMQHKIMESLQNQNQNLFQPHHQQQNYQAQQTQQVIQQVQKPRPQQQPKKEENLAQYQKYPSEHKYHRAELVDSYLPQSTFYNKQFESQFDNVKVPENKFENVKQMQSSRQKIQKSMELHTDLQPPPENLRRRRLIIIT